MKGQAVIQLFEDGKEVCNIVEDNLITNAYKNFMEQVLNNYQSLIIAPAVDTVSKTFSPSKFAEGVILFDTAQTESVDTTFITGGDCIGHAGTAYAGTENYRGNYNAFESGAITNGYKRVWDFATNQANGTINSVCLTTAKGGNYGYRNVNTYEALSEYASTHLTDNVDDIGYSEISYTGMASWYDNCLAGFSTDAKKLYVQDGASGTVYLKIYVQPDTGALGFLEIPQPGAAPATNSISKVLGANEYIKLCVINDVIYGVLYNSSTKAAYLKTYDDTFTELTSVTLTGSKTLDTSSSTSFGIVNGYLFVYSGTTNIMRKYNSSTGAYVEDYTIPIGSFNRVRQFNNQFIIFWYKSGTYIYVTLYDGTTLYGKFTLKIYDAWGVSSLCCLYPEKSAIFIMWYGSGTRGYCAANLFAPVLFTVNNLATPVVKTSALTMKITYTITW